MQLIIYILGILYIFLKYINEDETFTSAISYEDDQKYILNTEKWISFEEGKEQGFELEKRKTIQNMYNQNYSIDEIAKIVELSEEKVKEILISKKS